MAGSLANTLKQGRIKQFNALFESPTHPWA